MCDIYINVHIYVGIYVLDTLEEPVCNERDSSCIISEIKTSKPYYKHITMF